MNEGIYLNVEVEEALCAVDIVEGGEEGHVTAGAGEGVGVRVAAQLPPRGQEHPQPGGPTHKHTVIASYVAWKYQNNNEIMKCSFISCVVTRLPK